MKKKELIISLEKIQSGPTELTEETLGVNYRALSDLFVLSQERKHTICYDISVQMLEIYNDQIRDLLATDSTNRRYPSHCIWLYFVSYGEAVAIIMHVLNW